MEPKEDLRNSEEEIDLYELWLRLKKRWKVILSAVLVCLGLSAVYILITEPVYESSFIVRTYVITPKETLRYMDHLENYLKRGKHEDLAELLDIEKDTSAKIVGISAREVRGSNNIVEVNLRVATPEILPLIAQRLVSYLNRNPYVLERLSLRKRELILRQESLERRIKALVETREIIKKLIKQGEAIYFNPAEIDRVIEEFREELINVKNELTLLKGFELSVKPPVPSEPSKPRKGLVLGVSLLSSLFLGIFLALFLEWLETARRRHAGM